MNDKPEKASDRHATYDESYTKYQTGRSAWRQWVRDHYLKAAASYAIGPSLDFGCGAGELLGRLPGGSMGIEYNRATVERCQCRGLHVEWYDGFKDDFSLNGIPWQGHASTLYLSHVLEHFDDPVHVLTRLASTVETEAQRIVIIVPGRAGFKLDPTHRVFVDDALIEKTVGRMPHWVIRSKRHFPFNHAFAGDVLAHNELQVVIDKISTA